VDVTRTSKNRTEIFNDLREGGIGVNVHYIPIHTHPYYQQFGFSMGDFPNAESYYNKAISIPLFHTMTELQQNEVTNTLREILR